MFKQRCIRNVVRMHCDCDRCGRDRVDEREEERRRSYAEALVEERRGLVLRFDEAIKLGEDRERLPNPHGPIGATLIGERTGVEIARELNAALAAVDAEIKRAAALNR